jgi:toxin FitB
VILLDTNVVSALMQREPDGSVVAWLDRQPEDAVWTTTVTVFEVRFGIALLEDGGRRERLEAAFDAALTIDLGGRVLPFDPPAASAAASLAAERRVSGRPVDVRDTFIAGIARARRAAIATRNTRHFEGCGLTLIDPWSA